MYNPILMQNFFDWCIDIFSSSANILSLRILGHNSINLGYIHHAIAYFLHPSVTDTSWYSHSDHSTCWWADDTLYGYSFFAWVVFDYFCVLAKGFIGSDIGKTFGSSALEGQTVVLFIKYNFFFVSIYSERKPHSINTEFLVVFLIPWLKKYFIFNSSFFTKKMFLVMNCKFNF